MGTLNGVPTSITASNIEKIKEYLIQPPYNSIAVFPPTSILDGHELYSSLILRPLLNYVISNDILAKSEEDYSNWDSFVKLNNIFVDSIKSIFEKGDIGK